MKRYQGIRLFALAIVGVLTLFSISRPCLADSPSKQSDRMKDTVTFEGYGLPVDWDSIPRSLASALKAHPDTKRFRTDWNFSEGGGSVTGAVLYDRTSKTLKYYERDYDSSSVSTFLYTYTKVADESIQKLRADLENVSQRREVSPANSGFDALLKFGCRRTGGWRRREL